MSTSRVITGLACAIVVLHAAILMRTGGAGGGSLGSNLVQLAAGCLAVFSCFLAARRLSGFVRRFWFLMGISFVIWTIAQAGATYWEDFQHRPMPTMLWMCAFFFVAPMGLALLLPADEQQQEKHWTFFLDFAQLAIVVMTAYFCFMIPTIWHESPAEIEHSIRISTEFRNYVVLGAFLVRIGLTPARGARPFKQMAIVLAMYTAAASLYFHLTKESVFNTGLWFDLGWSAPMALAAVFACQSQVATEEEGAVAPVAPWRSTLAFHVMPLLTPLLVIALAARVVTEQIVLAATSVTASVFIAIARVFVTDMKREETAAALKETEEKYRLLFVNNPHPMWVVDVDTLGMLDVNDAALQRYGWTREEFLTKTIRDVRAPEDIPMIETDVSAYPKGSLARELMHRTKNGETFPVSATARAITLHGRRAAIVMAEDISERRAAESALKRSQEMLALHIQQTPLAFIEWSLKGEIMEWNRAAEHIFGYSRQEALGNTFALLVTPAFLANVEEIQRTLLEGKGSGRSTNPNMRKDKKVIMCDWYNTTIKDASGRVLGMASLVQDVTEQRSLEERLRQSQKMEAIGTLAGGVAHDFNNLLTVISGYTSLLQERHKQEGRSTDDLDEVMEASHRAAALTNQLLTFSRKQVTQTVVLDLNESVSRMEKMLRRVIGEDVRLQTDLASDLHAVKADSGQLDQVIMNLAVNARDAMPNGGTLRFSTVNTTYKDSECPHEIAGPLVMLSVSDTGTGMDAATIEHIFEPFFTTKKGKGTGLGLSTVFGIVESAGGAITVNSATGKGTTFNVFFPSANKASLLEKRRKTTGVMGGAETILLVEDERSVRDLASVILRSYGYNVLLAESGAHAEAMSLEFTKPIHLLVTDVIMPGLSGPQTMQRLRIQRPGLLVLYTSGYTDNELTRTTLGSDPRTFLQKPFTPDTLAKKVREILDANIEQKQRASAN